jgi:hypothetical protein
MAAEFGSSGASLASGWFQILVGLKNRKAPLDVDDVAVTGLGDGVVGADGGVTEGDCAATGAAVVGGASAGAGVDLAGGLWVFAPRPAFTGAGDRGRPRRRARG